MAFAPHGQSILRQSHCHILLPSVAAQGGPAGCRHGRRICWHEIGHHHYLSRSLQGGDALTSPFGANGWAKRERGRGPHKRLSPPLGYGASQPLRRPQKDSWNPQSTAKCARYETRLKTNNEISGKQEKRGARPVPLLTWQMRCRRLQVLPCWRLHLLPCWVAAPALHCRPAGAMAKYNNALGRWRHCWQSHSAASRPPGRSALPEDSSTDRIYLGSFRVKCCGLNGLNVVG